MASSADRVQAFNPRLTIEQHALLQAVMSETQPVRGGQSYEAVAEMIRIYDAFRSNELERLRRFELEWAHWQPPRRITLEQSRKASHD